MLSSFKAPRLSGCPPQARSRCSNSGLNKRGVVKVVNVGWDPDNVLGPPQSGHIARREAQKKYGQSGSMVTDLSGSSSLQTDREIPEKDEELVEYFLVTQTSQMETEVARCRPRLSDEFFRVLDRTIGEKRLLESGQEDRVKELEALRSYLKQAVETLDSITKELATTTLDRLRKLLTAPDKQATILEMAERNEIDKALIELLNQNIESAKASGNDKAVQFMEKLRGLCVKHVLTSEKEEPQQLSNVKQVLTVEKEEPQ
eukprot:TRINITY_DN11974_c0_g1_i8.p1 TRINITY_DN11974_c0_g1~~TRINITY_DN11974_c0_g1_i8.p1  ORF type:complete len:277 (+),score=45.69 TRINITY_DN11974_c0_g1_i8:55-831(+)